MSAASSEFCLVLSTCPDDSTARALAESLVTERLAACVNIVPGLRSIYRWEGRIESAEECLLIAKIRRSVFDDVSTFLDQRHPYEVPEIIAVPVEAGSSAYLQWLSACVTPEADS